MVRTYNEFLNHKAQYGKPSGFEPTIVPSFLFDFQKSLVEWSVQQGRCAVFADCGLGKTLIQLVWAQNVVEKTNRPVLILTPLAVSTQTIREARKFGIDAERSRDGSIPSKIVVTNYEMLDRFRESDFVGVVCDESSILKNFDGVRRGDITHFARKMPYRLLCTATAAPNDYIELGTSAEALGVMGYMDMLNRFFKNTQNTSDTKTRWRTNGAVKKLWRFKRHAEQPFWRWVCSWARAIRRPSDMGYDDNGFVLPELVERETIIECSRPLNGKLFVEPAIGLYEQRQEMRETIRERCEAVANIVHGDHTAVVWCNLNDEGDLLESMIPGSRQVRGSMGHDEKEDILQAFSDGNLRVLVIKPKIGAFGLNWQHCSHTTFFPSHSYEQYYQGVRRLWRFGQRSPVTVDIVSTLGGHAVLANLQRKAKQADEMFVNLVTYMNESLRIDNRNTMTTKEVLPTWL